MDAVKNKTKIYLLIISLIMSLMSVAFMRFGQGGVSTRKPANSSQMLGGLEQSASSPQMKKFLQREKANEDANDDAYRDMGK
jgi:hypothetical protein